MVQQYTAIVSSPFGNTFIPATASNEKEAMLEIMNNLTKKDLHGAYATDHRCSIRIGDYCMTFFANEIGQHFGAAITTNSDLASGQAPSIRNELTSLGVPMSVTTKFIEHILASSREVEFIASVKNPKKDSWFIEWKPKGEPWHCCYACS